MSKVDIKATINANIKQNGVQAITGQILNSVLNTMVDDYAEQTELDIVKYLTSSLSASKADQTEVNELNDKINALSLGSFYGYYASAANLPTPTRDGYAYVGAGNQFVIYNALNGVWQNSGTYINKDTIVVTPQMYGALGDGIHDDAPAILNMIANLPNSNFCIVFPYGTYLQGDGQNVTPCKFDISNKSNFAIVGYGATILANKANSCIQENAGFFFHNCSRGTILGVTYNGNIAERKPSMGDAGSINKQSAFMLENCDGLSFRDCVATGAVMDGFTLLASYTSVDGVTISHPTKNCILENCVAEYCYRGGIAGVRADFCIVKNCQCNYNGTIYGTSPWFGIDLEDGYNEGQNGWIINGCSFKGNKGVAINISAGTHNTKVLNCTATGQSISLQHTDNGVAKCVNNIVKNCYFDGMVVSYVSGLSMYDCVIDTNAVTSDILSFANNGGRNSEVIDEIKGNVIHFNWDASAQTYTTGMVTERRGVTLRRSLVIENNVFENLTGYNPFFVQGQMQSFAHNTLRCTIDLSQYGTLGSRFTGEAMSAKNKRDNEYDSHYAVVTNNEFDYLNDNRGFLIVQPYVYNVKGATIVYDVTLGNKSYFDVATFVRVKHNNTTIARIYIENGNMKNNGYVVEAGTPSNTYSYAYSVDSDNIAHLLITSTSGGYYYPTIEMFGNVGKMNSILNNQMVCIRRNKTDQDAALTWFTPTA